MLRPAADSICDRKCNSASIFCADSACEKRIFTTRRPLLPGPSRANIIERDANGFVYGRVKVVSMFLGVEAPSFG